MRCPTCHKKARFDANPYRPFCSERCKLIDLGKWAAGAYRVPESGSGPESFADSGPAGPNADSGSEDVDRQP